MAAAKGIALPRRYRTASAQTADAADAAATHDIGPGQPAGMDHVYERLKLIVVMLEYAEAEARRIGSEETIKKTTAALASARRDLALHKVSGYERTH